MNEWLKDWLGTIAVLVYLLYPLLKQLLERRKRARQREQTKASSPAPEHTGPQPKTTRRKRAKRSPRPAPESRPQARPTVSRPGPQPRGRPRREERRLDLETQAVARFEARLERARAEALALIELLGSPPAASGRGGQTLAQLAEPLRRDLLPGIERMTTALRSERTMASARAQEEALQEHEATLASLRGLIEQRLSSAASVLNDVDSIARASYALFVSFAETQSLHLAERRPVAAPGPFDHDSLASTSIAPIQVPAGFAREVWGWPRIVHDVARDLFFSMEHLALDLHSRLGLPMRLPAPSTELELQTGFVRTLFGPWLPEVFADLVATLMLGPAYTESMLRTLASPRAPQRASAILTDRGFIAAQPPARLRLYMSCLALAHQGYQAEADALWSRWEAAQPNAQLYFLPLGGNWVGLSEDALRAPAAELVALMLSEPWPELGGLRLGSIPELAYGEREEAEARNLAAKLSEGQRVDADPRWLLAAAVMAASEAPERHAQILAAARRSLSPEPVAKPIPAGTGKGPRRSSIKAELRRSLRDPDAIRDAVVLGAALCPRPHGPRPRG